MFANILNRLVSTTKTIDKYWRYFIIIFWISLPIILIIYRINPIEQSLPNPTKELINFKNCPVSLTNEIKDLSPLKTNTTKGEIDLIFQTESGGVLKNQIPAITNPKFISLDQALKCIDPTEEVIVVRYTDIKSSCDPKLLNCEAVRIYPKSILVNNQIVNDNFENSKIIVTYSPLSSSYGVYISNLDEFAVSGRLYAGNTLIFDKKTESLWLQLNGKAIIGDRTGERLEPIVFTQTTFFSATQEYKNAQILSFDTGFAFDYSQDAYKDIQDNNPEKNIQIIGIDKYKEDKVQAYIIDKNLNYDFKDSIGKNNIEIKLNTKFDAFEVLEINDKGNTKKLAFIQTNLFTWKQIYPQSFIVEVSDSNLYE